MKVFKVKGVYMFDIEVAYDPAKGEMPQDLKIMEKEIQQYFDKALQPDDVRSCSVRSNIYLAEDTNHDK